MSDFLLPILRLGFHFNLYYKFPSTIDIGVFNDSF